MRGINKFSLNTTALDVFMPPMSTIVRATTAIKEMRMTVKRCVDCVHYNGKNFRQMGLCQIWHAVIPEPPEQFYCVGFQPNLPKGRVRDTERREEETPLAVETKSRLI